MVSGPYHLPVPTRGANVAEETGRFPGTGGFGFRLLECLSQDPMFRDTLEK